MANRNVYHMVSDFMNFDEKKCKVIHFGRENPGFDYHMNNITLPVTHDETDVGVVIQNTLKPSKHCAQVARKANAILGTIARSFHFKDRFTFLHLYKTYVFAVTLNIVPLPGRPTSSPI